MHSHSKERSSFLALLSPGGDLGRYEESTRRNAGNPESRMGWTSFAFAINRRSIVA